MTAREYNARVAEAARHQPLPGYIRRGAGGPSPHHWPIRFRRTADPSRRWWALFVGPGAVNERMAGITYLRTGDPRGWVMPPDHPGIAAATKLYGPDFELIDRRLTERQGPPHILVHAPSSSFSSSSSSSLSDLSGAGDFAPVPDADRVPLPFFRTARMWQLDLYRASVFLTAQPRNYSAAETIFHLPIASRPSRFRVAVAARLPSTPPGTALGGVKELAQIYLTRDPAAAQPLLTDKLYVRERCFWSLGTANAAPNPFGALNPLATDALPSFGGLGLGLADGFASATAAATSLLLDAALAELGALLQDASSVEFWSAA